MKYAKMIGKTYLYKAREHTIEDIETQESGLFKVTTNRTTLKVSEAELADFLPVAAEMNGKDKLAIYQKLEAEAIPMSELSTVLMDNIKKLQTDPSFADQARAVNETAKTLIDIAKLKVEIMKMVKGI